MFYTPCPRFAFVITNCLLLCLSLISIAQTGSLRGKITDTEGYPVEFVPLSLQRIPDSAHVITQTSDEQGHFVFPQLPKGNYLLKAQQIGYQAYTSEAIEIVDSEEKMDIKLHTIHLASDEVVVEAQKPLVRQEPDKMVVDVENTVANTGLNAQDVLQRSPGVSIDKDGRISIKGKSGVLIMIDDKALYMSEGEVANLLKSIPSDQIKELEVITSPSAKYDAVGSAGIINIRLKKGAYEGLTGSFVNSLGHGVYPKANTGINLSYKKKKLSFNAGYQFNFRKDLSDEHTWRTYTSPNDPYGHLNSDIYVRYTYRSHSGFFNGQYKLDKRNTLTFDFTNSYIDAGGSFNGTAVLTKKDNSLYSSSTSKDAGAFQQMNLNVGVGHQLQIDTNGTTLVSSINYNRLYNYNSNNLTLQNLDSSGQNTNNPFYVQRSNPAYSNQFSAKTDYNRYIWKKIKWESGLKVNLYQNDNPSILTVTENSERWDGSNHFIYTENIYAAYALVKKKWNKWKAEVGLRLEHTYVQGTQTIQDTSFVRNYTNLFPSGNLSFSLNPKTSWTLLYSKRIQRPNPYQLNPVLFVQDPYTAWGGNPYLLPQYTHNIELTQSLWSGLFIASLNYSVNLDHISQVVINDPNGLRTQGSFLNMKRREQIGLSLTVNTPIAKWWTTSNFVNLFQNRFQGGQGYENLDFTKATWTANSTQTFKLPAYFAFELSGNYEAPNAINAFATTVERWQVNAGLSKKLWASKGTFKLAITDMFWTYRSGSNTTLDSTQINFHQQWDNRVLMFTFTYKFGNKVSISQDGKS